MKLEFGKTEDKKWSCGVSKGVLFVLDKLTGNHKKGVVWNGLQNVTESPEGAEPNQVYADDEVYATTLSTEKFKGTIACYYSPKEFDACEGVEEEHGVHYGQQEHVPFALCYRTTVGAGNAKIGYKIHIIYGCLAAPTERDNATVNESTELQSLSYAVTTTPVKRANGKVVAHLWLDSTTMSTEQQANLAKVEEYLYGSETKDSRLLMPDEIDTIMSGGSIEAEEEPQG